jgi:outer membrane protein TolC
VARETGVKGTLLTVAAAILAASLAPADELPLPPVAPAPAESVPAPPAGGTPPDPEPPAGEPEPELASAEETVLPAEGARTLTLSAALAMALEYNFGLLSSADQVRDARLGYTVTLSDFFPRLTPHYARGQDDTRFGLTASQRLPWTGGSVQALADFASQPDTDSPLARSSNLRLELTQPLLRGFGPNTTYYELRNSRRTRETSERSFELRRQQVALDVSEAYYEVVQQRALLAVSRQSLKRTQALERASEARLQVGLVSKLDVFRAQLQAAQSQEAAVRAERALGDALERFRFLLGQPPTVPLEPDAAALPDMPAEDMEPLEVLIDRARGQRLELLETRDQVEDARRTASLAKQNLLPQLDLRVGFSDIGFGRDFGGAWSNADRQYHFGLVTSYPIKPAADAAAKASADIRVSSSVRLLRERELEVESEVRRAVRELGEIRQSVDLQRKAVTIAQQQHRLAALRFQRGLASNFDVVEAEESLLLARSALVGLLTRYQIRRVRLLKATGTLDLAREFGLNVETVP